MREDIFVGPEWPIALVGEHHKNLHQTISYNKGSGYKAHALDETDLSRKKHRG